MALFSAKEQATLPLLTQFYQLTIPEPKELVSVDLVGSELDAWLLTMAKLRGDNIPPESTARVWSDSHLKPAEPLLPTASAELIVSRTLAALAELHTPVCKVMKATAPERSSSGDLEGVQEACAYLNDATARYVRRDPFQVEGRGGLSLDFPAVHFSRYMVTAPDFWKPTDDLPLLAGALVAALLADLATGVREKRFTFCKRCGNPFYIQRRGTFVCSERCRNRIRASRGNSSYPGNDKSSENEVIILHSK